MYRLEHALIVEVVPVLVNAFLFINSERNRGGDRFDEALSATQAIRTRPALVPD